MFAMKAAEERVEHGEESPLLSERELDATTVQISVRRSAAMAVGIMAAVALPGNQAAVTL